MESDGDDDDQASLSGQKRKLEDLSHEERQQRSRERNREHARRTRMRKKAQLVTLQMRVAELENEGARLEQALQDCATANILLGMSNPACRNAAPRIEFKLAPLQHDNEEGSSRARSASQAEECTRDDSCTILDDDSVEGGGQIDFRSTSEDSPQSSIFLGSTNQNDVEAMQYRPQSLSLMSGRATAASKLTIHWKSGYTLDQDGQRRDLTPDELDTIRRERNRLHAKMTRDRKKQYLEKLAKTVSSLECENRRVRDALNLQLNAAKQQVDGYLKRFGVDFDD